MVGRSSWVELRRVCFRLWRVLRVVMHRWRGSWSVSWSLACIGRSAERLAPHLLSLGSRKSSLETVYADFVHTSVTYGRTIISEYFLHEYLKSVR